jgi:hypothetical protein
MSRKPRSKKEAILRRQYEEVDNLGHLTDQQKREERRAIKRRMRKLDRQLNRQELEENLADFEEE